MADVDPRALRVMCQAGARQWRMHGGGAREVVQAQLDAAAQAGFVLVDRAEIETLLEQVHAALSVDASEPGRAAADPAAVQLILERLRRWTSALPAR